MRTSPGAWPFASFGATRVCLLVSFVLISGTTYLYIDTHTIHKFLRAVQEDPYGSLHAFLVVYTLSVVVLFPCMILQVMSGALYGFWMGMVVSWIATSAGQTLAFLLGRYLFRPTVKSYLHNTWPTFPAIDAAIKKEGWKLVCLLRLSPVLPYNILNYALAITPVSIWVFSVASAVATIPWTALYVYLGTFSTNLMDLTQGKIHYGENMAVLKKVASGLFIIVTTVYGYMLSHRAITSVLKEAADHMPPSSGQSSATNSTADLVALDRQERITGGGGAGLNGTTAIKYNGVELNGLIDRGLARDAESGKG